LYQRKLVQDPRVQGALRWRGEDPDPEVRRLAFLLSLYTRERLLAALRQRDTELDRQLTELESGTLRTIEETPAVAPAPEAAPQPAVPPPLQVAAGIQGVGIATAISNLEKMVQAGMMNPQALARAREMLERLRAGHPGLRPPQAPAGAPAPQPPAQPTAPPPSAPAGVRGPGIAAALSNLEKLAQAGMMSPEALARAREMLERMQGGQAGLLGQIAAQIQAMAQRKPPPAQAEPEEDDSEEDLEDEDAE
jgi:hypothetical protein